MNGNGHEKSPGNDRGGGKDMAGGPLSSLSMIADFPSGVKHDPLPFDVELPPYPLPVAGGKLCWVIQDTVSSLLVELQARGLDLPEGEIDRAVASTWVSVASADYVTGKLRTWGNRAWEQGWRKHFKALRERDNEVGP